MKHYDVAILGAGPSGLTAALALSRVKRPIVVFDSRAYRNATSPHVHTVLGHDGRSNAELRMLSRDQISSYKVATFVDGEEVVSIAKTPESGWGKAGKGQTVKRFEITTDRDTKVTSAAIIFATGIVDVLPSIPGLKDLWDQGLVHACPYCHGWERRGGSLAMLAPGPPSPMTVMGLTKSLLLNSPLTLLTSAPIPSDNAACSVATKKVLALGGDVDPRPVASVSKADDGSSIVVHFVDGGTRTFNAMMTSPGSTFHPSTKTLLDSLGIDLSNASPMLGQVLVPVKDEMGHTETKGVYVAGDLGTLMRAVPIASMRGMGAGVAAHADLIEEEVEAASST